MNKKSWIVIIIILIILVGIGFYFYFSNNKDNNNNQYETNKVSSQSNTSNTTENEEKKEDNSSQEENRENSTEVQEQATPETTTPPKEPTYTEKALSSFSTKIYSKDSARQNNIKITSNTLNGTVVKKGETFSFCNTLGPSTSAKGYQKADIYDRNGNKKKGLGGGNCQVSSTLYNAVLAVPSLVVTERHEHSNNVPYVAKGKDAAVAYGSYDFKFRNDSSYDIKIYVEPTSSNLSVRLVSIVYE